MKKINTYEQISIITLRGIVVYPGNKMYFDIIRKKSINALQYAMNTQQNVFLVTQKELSVEDPGIDDIFDVGVVAKVIHVIKNNDGGMKVLVEVTHKAKIIEIYNEEECLKADIKEVVNAKCKDEKYCAGLVRTAKDLFDEYCKLLKKIPEDVFLKGISLNDPVFVAEYIASNTLADINIKQYILECNYPEKKLEILVQELNNELDLIAIEDEILEKLQKNIEKNQKEYYLREQIKVISEELGEETVVDEKLKYETQIKNLKLKDNNSEEVLLKEVNRMVKMPSNSPELTVIRSYIETCLNLPWNKFTTDKINIEKTKELLNKDHYGLEKVKERILEFLSLKKYKPGSYGQILCLCGPPGVGKTSIAQSIAKTMGRKYVRISLGGIKDESEIRGHRRTYIGSMPGRIINAIKTAGTSNPLMLLDEVDKMSNDFRGDPSSAMLEVLDFEQNSAFIDHYLDIPFDLSNVLFIATANNKYEIPAPLLDRMEVIDLTSYTSNEKFHIAKNHLIPKQLKLHGLTNKDVKIADDAIFNIIDFYTSEAGVRGLERNISKIYRKVVQQKVYLLEKGNPLKKINVTSSNLVDFLGSQKFVPQKILDSDEIGVVTGLAWTSVGGEIMHIEVSALEGTGKLELTGNLGDVMKESAKAAISYIRSHSDDLGVDKNFYKNKDIHIHVPEGAVPKDGPSAGVAICTAIVSELTQIPVKKDVSMTGEITLRGRLLTIGGLKEKTMAAYKTGVKTVFIPKGNEPDLAEIDEVVKSNVNFISANKIETVLEQALIFPTKQVNYSLKANLV